MIITVRGIFDQIWIKTTLKYKVADAERAHQQDKCPVTTAYC